MAKRVRRSYTSGKTTAELANLDPANINRLTRKQLAEVVSDLGATVNKRIKAAQKKGLQSPALYNEGGYVPKVTAKGKTLSELRAEYMRAKLIYQGKTSTIKGIKEWKNQSLLELSKYGIQLTPKEFNTFWKIYEHVRNTDKRVEMKALKYNVLSEINRLMNLEQSPDDAKKYFTSERITDIYERSIIGENNDDEGTVSNIFKRKAEKIKRRTGFGANH